MGHQKKAKQNRRDLLQHQDKTIVIQTKGNRVYAPREVKRILDAQMEDRLRVGAWLLSDMFLIWTVVTYINAAVTAGRGDLLMQTLFAKRDIEILGKGLDRIGELQALYNQIISDWQAFDPKQALVIEKAFKDIVEQYVGAMQHLKNTGDHEPLLALALYDPIAKEMALLRQQYVFAGGRPNLGMGEDKRDLAMRFRRLYYTLNKTMDIVFDTAEQELIREIKLAVDDPIKDISPLQRELKLLRDQLTDEGLNDSDRKQIKQKYVSKLINQLNKNSPKT